MARRRGSVTRRLLASYLVLLVAFTVTMGLGYRDLRTAKQEAELSRSALVPLELNIGQALAEQNVLGAQLNHATSARNPADVRGWIETARKGRPITLSAARKAAENLDAAIPAAARLRTEALAELVEVEQRMHADAELYRQFFDALEASDATKSESIQRDIVKYEAETAQRLRSIKTKTEATMERLGEQARARERLAVELLVAMSALTLLVAAGITLYARRVLAPLGVVTSRARTVASGDLTPRAGTDDNTEIGELATTFEAMVAAIRDARLELVKAERLATVGKMAAHITHEIRNPLSAIGLNLEMLEAELEGASNEPGGAEEARELVVAIKAEANRLSKLSEQYLSLARRRAPVFAREPLGELAEEVLAFLKPELDRAKVELEVVSESPPPMASFDESLLRQAIVNLIRNAREAMPDGGKIRVTVGAAPDGGADLSIEDSGPGIPEELRANIFDPFFTTKQRGTGLGLAVTREIVEAHRGTIACEPRASGASGTRFVIHLPPATA